jgi:peptidoglycan/LPS O-acetylase OafA/YrhL
MTLSDTLSTRDNALNFVRLVLAGLVIVSHTWPVCGFGKDPRLGDLNLGGWAVAGFFAISGYLVTGSRMRLSLDQYVLRRALRIYPGFWICLLVVAFVFAPLGALAARTPFDLGGAASFVWSNSTTMLFQLGVGGELGRVPYGGIWDGSLWTLTHELACYIFMGVVLTWGWARRDLTRTVVGVWGALTVFNVASAQVGLTRGTMPSDFLRLAAYFAAGSLLWSVGDRVRVTRWWVVGSACLLGLLALFGVVDLLGALPLAYLVLAFGAWCPIRWGVDRDLSYGVYVYAWPVQQMLVLAGVNRFGPVACIAAAVALVVPLAWMSWTLVEHPALRLGRRRSQIAVLSDERVRVGTADPLT